MNIARILRQALVCVSLTLSLLQIARSEPVITIDEDTAFYPSEAFLESNPFTVINVEDEGIVAPSDTIDHPHDHNGATLNISNGGSLGFRFGRTFLDDVRINVLSGGKVAPDPIIWGLTGATVMTVDGGTTQGLLRMHGNSILDVRDGLVGKGGVHNGQAAVIFEDTASSTIRGGELADIVLLRDNSYMRVTGGVIGDTMDVVDQSQINIAGGTVGRAFRLNSPDSYGSITGGTVGRSMLVEEGLLEIIGGAVERDAFNNSVVNMTGGVLAENFRNSGELNVWGGTVSSLSLHHTSETNLFVSAAFIDGVRMDLTKGLTSDITLRDGSFLTVEFANGGTYGQTLSAPLIPEGALLTVTWVDPIKLWADCDFDGNGCGQSDVDLLVENIVATDADLMLDLTGDLIVDSADLTKWLSEAGYREGDANLDGSVNELDLAAWQAHSFRSVSKWSFGDFNADGAIDVADFNVWNANRTAAASPASVPEPNGIALLVAMFIGFLIVRGPCGVGV